MPGYFRYFDWLFFAPILGLCLIGLMMVYSTGLSGGASSDLWIRQLIYLAIGLAGFFFLSRLDYRFFRRPAAALYALAVLMLVFVLIFGREIRGSTRWFDFGLVTFQPAEFLKFALIILMAKFFHKHGGLIQKFRYVLWSLCFVLIPAALIMLQPDLGSAIVVVSVWGGMLLISPVPPRYFLYLLIAFLILASVSWQFLLADYQKDRVHTFLNPAADPLGRGYNVLQSMVAVGSGGIFGQGLARGLQSQLKFLPERQTDFIFASTVEELGLLGGGLVVLLLAFLLYRMVKIMRGARDLFGTYLVAGIFFLVFSQAVINIGMNLGIMPVTGITLPFMSYGGSSLVVLLLLMGVMENIARDASPVRFA